MTQSFTAYQDLKALLPRNWEGNIARVSIESCGENIDPLGYRAIFHLDQETAKADERKSFVIGASFLRQRKKQLNKAGYKAPMTKKAIALLEKQIGFPLGELAEAL